MSARTFKCGACGTEATGIGGDLSLREFSEQHAVICPGWSPAFAWDAFRAGFACSAQGWNGELAADRGWDLEAELAAPFAKYRARSAGAPVPVDGEET